MSINQNVISWSLVTNTCGRVEVSARAKLRKIRIEIKSRDGNII